MSPSSSCARYTELSLSLNVEMIPDTVPTLFILVSLSKSSIVEPSLNSEKALEYLNKYLEINPNADDVDFILELIRSIKTKN